MVALHTTPSKKKLSVSVLAQNKRFGFQFVTVANFHCKVRILSVDELSSLCCYACVAVFAFLAVIRGSQRFFNPPLQP
jgi:hypothetical protein